MTNRVALIAAVATFGAVVEVTTASAQPLAQLQLGLRFSSEHSMQWSGGRIFLEGHSRDVVDTTARRIHEVWPGSVRGAFAVSYDDSVGLLLGDGIVPAGPLFGERALLRSSRHELVCAAMVRKRSDGTVETRFVEWRTITLSRVLAVVNAAVVDFDVDVSSRLLYLTADGRVFLLASTEGPGAEIPLPDVFTAPPERVFIDATSAEVVVFGGSQLARLTIASGIWTVVAFDIRQQALVRHVTSRRIRPESRFR